ncbi:carbonic anhydrase [Mycena floridula]|nr:carbonic anhydrase [Mycena floridula]
MTSSIDYIAKNAAFAADFKPESLDKFADTIKHVIVTCMDHRIELVCPTFLYSKFNYFSPYAQFGAKYGETLIIRNGGGSAKEALRSLIVAQHYGIRNIAIFHHTGCGMTGVTTKALRDEKKQENPGNKAVADAIDQIDFLEFVDIDDSVKKDVEFLRGHPLIYADSEITGWTHDLQTGKVHQVL